MSCPPLYPQYQKNFQHTAGDEYVFVVGINESLSATVALTLIMGKVCFLPYYWGTNW